MLGLIFSQVMLVFLWIHDQRNVGIVKPKNQDLIYLMTPFVDPGFLRCKISHLVFPEKLTVGT